MKSPISRSISMKLSAIARKQGTIYKYVLTEFFIERLLARLVGSKVLESKLIFKGGYVGRRAYGSPRYTVDLDALMVGARVGALQSEVIRAVETDLNDGAWFKFENTVDLETQGEYPGIRFIFRTGLGDVLADLKLAQVVHFDVGTGDFALSIANSLTPMLEGKEIGWMVYSKEVMVAEKLHSCLSKPVRNSRSKDIFDLMYYLPDCKGEVLKETIRKCFEARGDRLPADLVADFKSLNTEMLKKGWASAISGLEDVGSFDDAFKKVATLLKGLL